MAVTICNFVSYPPVHAQVSVGGLHACALTLDEVAKDYAGGKSMICWGNNRMRQVG